MPRSTDTYEDADGNVWAFDPPYDAGAELRAIAALIERSPLRRRPRGGPMTDNGTQFPPTPPPPGTMITPPPVPLPTMVYLEPGFDAAGKPMVHIVMATGGGVLHGWLDSTSARELAKQLTMHSLGLQAP